MYAIIDIITPITASPAIRPFAKNIALSAGFFGNTENRKLINPPKNTGIVSAIGRYIPIPNVKTGSRSKLSTNPAPIPIRKMFINGIPFTIEEIIEA